MTKANTVSIFLIALLIIVFGLSIIGVIKLTLIDVLYLLLITAGIALVYIGTLNNLDAIVFLGTCFFLSGVLLLTKSNFIIELESSSYPPIIILIAAAGFLIVFLTELKKKIYLIISFVLFAIASVILITQSRLELPGILNAILPILNVYWPIVIIFILLLLLLRKEL